ncbi:NAD(P)H-binding protein [Streptomyces sp. NBC_00670]|uniref:NAD(P)H-binding protein n=1 Tax=Streptomyces sp. NBC_00670 TaxID=2975804 RepID=UPI002E2FE34A|nr:NAD(P)H-binding protein [Streptomyces sp. NBC_00670]
MRLFVIGATGSVGGAVARHLGASGHTVSGPARSQDAAARLRGQGITAVRADLDTGRPAVLAAARAADAVLYAAQTTPEQETSTVRELTRALAGTGKTLSSCPAAGSCYSAPRAPGAPTSSPRPPADGQSSSRYTASHRSTAGRRRRRPGGWPRARGPPWRCAPLPRRQGPYRFLGITGSLWPPGSR